MKAKLFLLAGAATVAGLVAAPALAADWWENTSISGQIFYDMSNIDQTYHNSSQPTNPVVTAAPTLPNGAAATNNNNGTGFDMKRFQITLDHSFNSVFSSELVTDFNYSSATSETQIFVKKAFVQAKIDKALVFKIGAADMPWIPYVDGIYGYRYVEQDLTNRTNYANPYDWGGFVSGDLLGDLFSYSLAVVNGNGYKNPARADQVDVEGRISMKWNGLNVAVGGYDGKRGATDNSVPVTSATNATCVASTTAPAQTSCHTTSRFDALVGYVANGFHTGFEYFTENNWSTVKSANTDKTSGYSVFGAYDVTPQWAVFGRYDWLHPEITTASPSVPGASNIKDNYYNFGVQYSPYQLVNIALVYKHETVTGGAISTANGNIGGIAGQYGNGDGHYREIGLFGTLKW